MDSRVFTRRSSVGALTAGALVAVVLGQLLGAPRGLAAIAGLPAGATVLAVSFGVRNRMFRVRPRPWGPVPGIGALLVGQTVVLVPAFFSGRFLELNRGTDATLALLFLLTGFAALMFGYIVGTLEQLGAAEDASHAPLSSANPQDQPPSIARESGRKGG